MVVINTIQIQHVVIFELSWKSIPKHFIRLGITLLVLLVNMFVLLMLSIMASVLFAILNVQHTISKKVSVEFVILFVPLIRGIAIQASALFAISIAYTNIQM